MYVIGSRGTWGKKLYCQYHSDRTVSDAPACVCLLSENSSHDALVLCVVLCCQVKPPRWSICCPLE